MSKSVKLAGIELCRGLAAFAVILVHSGDQTWNIPIADSAITFRRSFYFAVPFFVAAYFYFATKKAPSAIAQQLWQRKVKRIIIPYLLWSILFLLSKSITFFLTGNINDLEVLWSDPWSLVFFGGASYHLYFLPLILSGTLLLYSAKYLLKQNRLLLILECIISVILYQWLLTSENQFVLGEYIAFPPILNLFTPETIGYWIAKVILINLAWIVNCIPYFLIALTLNQVWQLERHRWVYYRFTSIVCLLLFLLMNIFREDFAYKGLLDVAIAYTLLLWGISISKGLHNKLIVNLGYCSFGIYFIHPYMKSIVDLLLTTFTPQLVQSVSVFSMLLYSISTFILSWLVIYLGKQNKFIAQYI